MKKLLFFLFCLALGPVSAQTTYNFTFSGVGISASGSLTVTAVAGTNYSTVTALSGTQNGQPITLLAPGAYEGNDNRVYPNGPAYLDAYGLGFSAGGGNYNVWHNSQSGEYLECGGVYTCYNGPALTFTLTQGPPPLTLSVSSNGLASTFAATCNVCIGYIWTFGDGAVAVSIANTQTHIYANAGTYVANVYSVDVAGNNYSAGISTGALIAALVISPNPLPNATCGRPYGVHVSATGGVPPYDFSILLGSLPPGLTLSNDGGGSGADITGTVPCGNSPTLMAKRVLSPRLTH